MPLDPSIYNNLVQFKAPDILGDQQRAASLATVGMQNQHMSDQMMKDKQQKKLLEVGGTYEKVMSLPEEQRPDAWNSGVQSLVRDGHLSPSDAIPYSPEGAAMIGSQLNSNPEWLGIKKMQMELASSKNDPLDRELSRGKTRAEIAKLNAEAGKESKENLGKPLAAEQADKLAGHDASLHMIEDLRNTIEANKGDFGPVAGRLSSLNPYNSRGQEVSALFKKAAQTIGKSLEGGKLTDQDYAKYQTMLPSQADTPEVAGAKLNQLERMVMSQRNSDINTYGSAGSNVSNFATTTPTDIEVTKKNAGGSSIIRSANATQINNNTSNIPRNGSIVVYQGRHFNVDADGNMTPVQGKK